MEIVQLMIWLISQHHCNDRFDSALKEYCVETEMVIALWLMTYYSHSIVAGGLPEIS